MLILSYLQEAMRGDNIREYVGMDTNRKTLTDCSGGLVFSVKV